MSVKTQLKKKSHLNIKLIGKKRISNNYVYTKQAMVSIQPFLCIQGGSFRERGYEGKNSFTSLLLCICKSMNLYWA